MIIHPYSELYLNRAMTSMAHMLDFAVRDLRQDAGTFFDLFVSSGTAGLFERGDTGVILGMSGVELAYRVLMVSGITVDKVSYRYTAGRSKEYWTGWALARYQWDSSVSFRDITKNMPMKDIIGMCDEYRSNEISDISASLSWMDNLRIPDHMNEENYRDFASRLDAAINAADKDQHLTSLKRIRIQRGLSQSQLAAMSGVPVRTIQQYEQRQKDIRKAQSSSVIRLAEVLHCDPAALIH